MQHDLLCICVLKDTSIYLIQWYGI